MIPLGEAGDREDDSRLVVVLFGWRGDVGGGRLVPGALARYGAILPANDSTSMALVEDH